MNSRSVNKARFSVFLLVYAITMVVIVREEITGAISPRAMAILLIAFVVAMTLVIRTSFARTILLSKNEDTIDIIRQKALRGIRRSQITLILMPMILLVGLWATRGGPLLPRFVGAVVNLGYTWSAYTRLRANKAQLSVLDTQNDGTLDRLQGNV